MKFNLAEALSAIFMKTKYEVGPDYSQYAIDLYLSKYKQYIGLVARLQLLKLPNAAHFKYLQKHTNFGWPHKVEIEREAPDPFIEYLIRYYNCSRRDAKDYLLYIDNDEKEFLKDYFEFKGDKDVKSSTDR